MSHMQISSLSVMAGTPACNLKCPFCVSKTTYRIKKPVKTRVPLDRVAFLADKFLKVCSGLPYGIITGKGEPTLVPKEELGEIIEILYADGKGLIPELQTNGVLLNRENMKYWKDKGLNTLALSCVSHLDEVNSRILSGERVITWNLGNMVREANDLGLLVRLTVILTRGGIDSPDSFLAFMNWAKKAGAHQVTFRKMGEPRNLARSGSIKVAQWIRKNYVDPDFIAQILREKGEEKSPWPWALKFGYEGMSVVVTDCMSPPKDNIVRHAVIQPDGHLYGSWDDPADIII